MLAMKSPELKQAVVELKRLSQTEEAQRLYEARQKAISDEKARMRTAKNKTLREVVANAFRLGLNNEQIVSLTGMTADDIEAMRTK